MESIYSKFPQLSNIKIKEISFEPRGIKDKKEKNQILKKYLEKNNEIIKRKSKDHSDRIIKTKQIISKIDTNRRVSSNSIDYQDIKFESVKWSESSILHPGFFNLPSIKKNSNYSYAHSFHTPSKQRKSLLHKKEVLWINKIDEKKDPSLNSYKISKKTSQIKTPWIFQTASYLTPNED